MKMPAWLEGSLAALPDVATRVVQRPGPIGLEIGGSNLYLCQLGNAQEGRYPVLARSITPYEGGREQLLDAPQYLKTCLRQATRGKRFRGNRIVTALPPDRVRFMPLMLKSEDANLDETVLKMVSDRVDGGIDEYVVDYLPVRTASGTDERLALAAVAQREHVVSYLDALSNAGYVVDALDIGPAAIRRALSSLYAGEGEGDVTLVVNTGATDTYLSVIAGRRLLLDQPVVFGENQLLEKLSESLDLSTEAVTKLVDRHGLPQKGESLSDLAGNEGLEVSETLLEVLKPRILDLIEEINRVLIYTASETRGRPINRILLLGSLARWSGFGELLCNLVGVPDCADYRDLDAGFDDRSTRKGNDTPLFPEMTVAVGLALRGMLEDV